MSPRIAVLDAPSNLGLMPPAPGSEPGVRRLPDALRARHLIPLIGAIDAGRVPPPAYDASVDAQSGVRNATMIASYSHALAERVGGLLRSGHFPLVLGGDCSILLGPLLALRHIGRFGLCFIDGHLDLLTPETSHTKGAAGMDLALALGHGPTLLANLDDLGPLVQQFDVAAVGYRDDLSGYGVLTSEEMRPDLLWLPLSEIRARGSKDASLAILSRIGAPTLDGFWIHLDVDVIDSEVMPAIDSPQPDGMSYAELGGLLAEVTRSPFATGMEVTILDPDRDPDGSVLDRFVTFLEELFAEFPRSGLGSA